MNTSKYITLLTTTISRTKLRLIKMSIKCLAILAIFSFALTSCEDVINVKLNPEDQNLYAVEAKITTINNPYVYLYKGMPVNKADDFAGISNAKVVITDNSTPAKKIQLTESPLKKGLYVVPQSKFYIGEIGNKYTVSIEVDGVTLTASDTLASVSILDSIEVRPSTRADKYFLGVFTFGKEPVGKGDFYKWEVFVNDTLLNNLATLAIANDDFVDGNDINNLEIFTDFHDLKKPLERKLKLNDTIVVRQNSISAFAYRYYIQLLNQSTTGSLFSIPPANVKSNFISSDGKPVLGLFSAHDISISNKVIITESIDSLLNKR